MNAEAFYRRLLLAYPRDYREQRGDELLATLLDAEDEVGQPGRLGRVQESLSLMRHGVSLRARVAGTAARGHVPALGLAGVALGVVLGVLGLHQLMAMAIRASGLHGFPAEWGVYVQWVDPRWPVHAAWVVVALALLTRRAGAAVAAARTAAVLHGWYLLAAAATGGQIPWAGNVGPFWSAPSGTAELGWFLLSLSAALLLGGRRRTALALQTEHRPLRRAALVGGVVAPATIVVGPALRALADEVTAPPYRFEGPFPGLLATAAVLAWALRYVEHGRGALLVLVVLAAAPLAPRWSESFTASAGALLLFAAGYLVSSLRPRASRPRGRPAP